MAVGNEKRASLLETAGIMVVAAPVTGGSVRKGENVPRWFPWYRACRASETPGVVVDPHAASLGTSGTHSPTPPAIP